MSLPTQTYATILEKVAAGGYRGEKPSAPPKQGGHASMGVGNFNTRGANLAKAQGANANLGSRIAKVPGKLSGGKPSWMNPVAKLPKMNPVAKLPKMLSGPVGANRRGPNDKVSKLGKQPFAPQYDKSVRPARIARSGILPAARKASSALLSGGAGTRNAMKSAFQPPAKRLVKKLKPNPYI
tara:strand:- start:461 stop:1006 length:546 start_codon:yes stop_codon:yes gene_type:complete